MTDTRILIITQNGKHLKTLTNADIKIETFDLDTSGMCEEDIEYYTRLINREDMEEV